MKFRLCLLLAMSGVCALPVSAASYSCSNGDLEIQCDEKCSASDGGVTPTSISVNTNGEVSFCAYSGCWEGNARVIQDGQHLLFSANELEWGHSGGSSTNLIMAIDTGDNVGLIKVGPFAMPVICEKSE